MKSLLLAGATLAILAGPALAQTTVIERRVIQTPAPGTVEEPMDDLDDTTTGTLDIAPEQEVIIRRRIVEERTGPATIEIQRGPVTIGSAIPRDVPLHPMSNFGSQRLANLAYFVSPDEKIVVVEPQTRRVVRIIDRQ